MENTWQVPFVQTRPVRVPVVLVLENAKRFHLEHAPLLMVNLSRVQHAIQIRVEVLVVLALVAAPTFWKQPALHSMAHSSEVVSLAIRPHA
jgi:hypothetical protein